MSKTNIKIGSVITPDMLDVAYISLNSIKQNKKSTTKIDYYLFIKYSFTFDEYYCKRKLNDLVSDDFQIHYLDANPYLQKINPQKATHDVVWLRCLFPKIFNDLDKILYLDTDVFCLRDGIEELWDMSLDDVYVKAAIDPLVSWSPDFCADLYNTQTKTYFNAGVMLLNLAKIREDGLDVILEKWTENWDFTIIRCLLYDQTLLNYFFRGHVDVLSPKWNNMFLDATTYTKQFFDFNLSQYDYADPIVSLEETVFVHFFHKAKPWRENEMIRGEKQYSYIKKLIELWDDIKTNYGVKTE